MVVFTSDENGGGSRPRILDLEPSLSQEPVSRSSLKGTLKSFFTRSRSGRSRKTGNSGNTGAASSGSFLSISISNITNIPSIFYRKRTADSGEEIVMVHKKFACFFKMVTPPQIHLPQDIEPALASNASTATSVKNHVSNSFTVEQGDAGKGKDDISPWFANFDIANPRKMVPCRAHITSLSEDAVPVETDC